jgi:aspartate/tyrosine/aromatic aminotransferase|tara:strand:+ start:144 stop:578 length:435 start_codon:yes stop_codon:yes gene_type:complete
MSNFTARETIPYTKKMLYTPADRKKIKAVEGGGERMGTPNIFKKKKRRIRKINKDLKTNIRKIKESPNFTGKNQSQRIQELKDTAKQDRKDVNKKYEESKNLLKDYGMMAPTSRGFDTIRKKHGGKITYKMTGGQVVDAGYDNV